MTITEIPVDVRFARTVEDTGPTAGVSVVAATGQPQVLVYALRVDDPAVRAALAAGATLPRYPGPTGNGVMTLDAVDMATAIKAARAAQAAA